MVFLTLQNFSTLQFSIPNVTENHINTVLRFSAGSNNHQDSFLKHQLFLPLTASWAFSPNGQYVIFSIFWQDQWPTQWSFPCSCLFCYLTVQNFLKVIPQEIVRIPIWISRVCISSSQIRIQETKTESALGWRD